MIQIIKTITLVCIASLSSTVYSMNTSNELVFYEEQNLPIRDAIQNVVKVSGKRVLFDSEIKGTSSFSINGVPWRRVLNSFLKVHNLIIDESQDAIFIHKKNSSETLQNISKKKQADPLVSSTRESVLAPNGLHKDTIDSEIEIKGVSGSQNNLKAIVLYKGRNQTWSVGNIINEKYRVVKIEEDGLTLRDLNKNDDLTIKFY